MSYMKVTLIPCESKTTMKPGDLVDFSANVSGDDYEQLRGHIFGLLLEYIDYPRQRETQNTAWLENSLGRKKTYCL
jgi:hypothetical protein